MADGFVKKKKKLDKKEVLRRDLKKLVNTCKANGFSFDEITEIVSGSF